MEENSMFTVMPMSQRFYLEPGETYTGKLTVINPADSKTDFNYKVSITPYSVVGEDYTADLATSNSHTQLTEWITIPEPTGTVSPNGTKDVEFTITVPKNAPAGGQYATIAIGSNQDNKNDNGVAVKNVFEMASVIYGTVAGETVRDGELKENNVPGFVAVPPLEVSALISNNGNIHEDATFVINVSNFLTGEQILPTEENDGEYTEIVMPESERFITREISNIPLIGIVKVKQTIYYRGDENIVEKNVIICPIWFMLLVFATIAAIIAAVVAIIRKHKKKKKSVA